MPACHLISTSASRQTKRPDYRRQRVDFGELLRALGANIAGLRVFNTLADFVERVGLVMKFKSLPLLQTAASEVIKELLEGTTFEDQKQ